MAGPPQGFHEVSAPTQAASGPPSGYHEVAPANVGGTPSGATPPIDLNAMGQKAFDLAGKWMNTPLMPASAMPETQIGNMNPAAAMSTPRNLAIGALGAGGPEGFVGDAAMIGLSYPEIKQGAQDIITPGRRLAGAGELAFAGIPGLHAAGNIGRDALTMGGIKLANSSVDEMSHNWLFNSARDSKQFLAQTKQGVEAHVGMLKNGLEMADKAAIPQGAMGSINLSSLAPDIDKIAQKYKGPLDIPLDKFDRAVDSFNKISGRSPYINLETLLDIRTGVGKLWHSARDSMDAAATAELRDKLTGLAKDRSAELKQTKQFESYNKVWRNLLEYEDQGTLGKLLNTPSGKPYFDMLNNKSTGPQLRQLNKDLSEQAGVNQQGQQTFPPDYFKKLAADHKDVYEFTNRPTGFRGAFSNIGRRTVAGLGGFLGGSALGAPVGHPVIGGIAGSTAAVSLADRIAAIRNMSRLGGTAPIEGLMGPRVEPDFGGGLSGRVIRELQRGPSGGPTISTSVTGGRGSSREKSVPLVSSPEDISRMQQADKQQSSPDMEAWQEAKRIGKPVLYEDDMGHQWLMGPEGVAKVPPRESFIEQQMNRPQPKSVNDITQEILTKFNTSKKEFKRFYGRWPSDQEEGKLWDDIVNTGRAYNPTISKTAQEVERIRAEKGKPVGEATRLANRKLGSSESTTSKDVQAQQDQAELLRKYLAGDPADVGRKVEELRQAIEKRKGKK